MDQIRLKQLLIEVRQGSVEIDSAVETLRALPFETIEGVAKLDHHRALRTGTPEVVYGEGKSAGQIGAIMDRLAAASGKALATRVDASKALAVTKQLEKRWPQVVYHVASMTLVIQTAPADISGNRRPVAVVSAGTSDEQVAQEAAVTAEFLGFSVDRVNDVGVAGLPRLIAASEQLRTAGVIIAVAGMEGALPTAISGLVERPVIAVPTSVGYGVGMGGFVAMMSMLASCSPGMTVVNIDNGFGAAMAAARILRIQESISCDA